MSLNNLIRNVLSCRYCVNLPYGPRPILQASSSARLCIIGQAPGKKVHETGIPWKDKSGECLQK